MADSPVVESGAEAAATATGPGGVEIPVEEIITPSGLDSILPPPAPVVEETGAAAPPQVDGDKATISETKPDAPAPKKKTGRPETPVCATCGKKPWRCRCGRTPGRMIGEKTPTILEKIMGAAPVEQAETAKPIETAAPVEQAKPVETGPAKTPKIQAADMAEELSNLIITIIDTMKARLDGETKVEGKISLRETTRVLWRKYLTVSNLAISGGAVVFIATAVYFSQSLLSEGFRERLKKNRQAVTPLVKPPDAHLDNRGNRDGKNNPSKADSSLSFVGRS